jgi:hypothetical protein
MTIILYGDVVTPRTYQKIVRPQHIMKKFQAFGISKTILDTLAAQSPDDCDCADWVKISVCIILVSPALHAAEFNRAPAALITTSPTAPNPAARPLAVANVVKTVATWFTLIVVAGGGITTGWLVIPSVAAEIACSISAVPPMSPVGTLGATGGVGTGTTGAGDTLGTGNPGGTLGTGDVGNLGIGDLGANGMSVTSQIMRR